MSSPQVLRIPNKDGSGHLLVFIEPQGDKTLDLNLTGTNTTELFKTTIKDATAKQHQSNKFTGGLKEWKALLKFVLLHKRPDGPLPDLLKGVDIVAEIGGSTFTITIRRLVGAITQTLGQIDLQEFEIKDDDEALDIFSWVHAAAASSDELRSQLQTVQKTSTEQQEEIARLTAELDQLVKEKRKHEEELLSKFAALLNEKKLKIRDQQRLLSHSKVEHDIAEEVRSERSKDPVSRKAGSSRSKRKARDEEDEEKVMTEDEEQTLPASDEETDAETADESGGEDEGGFAPAPSASQASSRRSAAPQSQSQPQQMDIDETSLPPARALPFSKAKAGGPTESASSSTQPKAVEEDDEETEDDEL